MAVPTARTWVDNDPLNTTNLNTGVRDPAKWMMADRPAAQLHQIVSQTLAPGVWTAITFTSEDYDTHNGHDNTTNTDQYVIPETGKYWLAGQVGWAGNATGRRGARFTLNGTAVNGTAIVVPAGTANQMTVPAGTILQSASAGDVLRMEGFQDSGGGLATNTELRSRMTILWERQ